MPSTTPAIIAWDHQRRLLARPGAWTTLALAFGLPAALSGVLAAILTRRVELLGLVPIGVLGALLTGFGVTVLLWETYGRRRARFELTATGARVIPSSAPHRPHETLWSDVTSVYVDPRRHYILLRRGFADRPVELYCTGENFWLVRDIVKARIPSIQM